ncbi:hypothetical protein BRARA_A02669 [Brassica rapa]|uniref:TF-B3 domain-containing protein n=1 Tax=Brassica campestris TaxID=3711 RepID=A0A398AWE3_BRACM|nr:hypothetical protein BRARA_A02669 [Brassica rapa]
MRPVRFSNAASRRQPIINKQHSVSSATRNEGVISLAHLRDKKAPGTELTLSINPDIWEIKKHLTVSDMRNNQTRLMLPKDDVVAHILDYLTDEERLMIEDANNRGLRIRVYDNDTESLHQLTLKKWHSSGSYVFISNWNEQFVIRRNLEAGDLIGLFWNTYASRLHFRVIRRHYDH